MSGDDWERLDPPSQDTCNLCGAECTIWMEAKPRHGCGASDRDYRLNRTELETHTATVHPKARAAAWKPIGYTGTCGCCGSPYDYDGDPENCQPCREHVLTDGPLWSRTYFAQHRVNCPNQVAPAQPGRRS